MTETVRHSRKNRTPHHRPSSRAAGGRITFITAILPLLLLIPSCTSLPLPDNARQSLLVVPVSFLPPFYDPLNQNRLTTVTKLDIEFREQTTGRLEKETLYKGPGYAYLAFDPGQYMIESVTAFLDSNENDQSRKIYADVKPFNIGEKTVTLLTVELAVIRHDPGGIALTSLMDFTAGDFYLAKLRSVPEWEAWEGYDLINFE